MNYSSALFGKASRRPFVVFNPASIVRGLQILSVFVLGLLVVGVKGEAASLDGGRQWTSMSKTQPATVGTPGVYGAQGTASAASHPGSREGSAAWTDLNGNLWMFGGYGLDAAGISGELNDLWRWNAATRAWSWMGGSATVAQKGAVYGAVGVSAGANTPGSREGAAAWTDRSGNLWLFGGRGYDAKGNYGPLNDLWKLNTTTMEWAWMGGASLSGQKSSAASGTPGARTGASAWSDANGNFWMFGGSGPDTAGAVGDLNELWEFTPATNKWTRAGGGRIADAPGVYGTKGVAAAANLPGGRHDASAWLGGDGSFWVFGGTASTAALLNDLWQYNPATKEWTWVSGNNGPGAKGGQPGVYGSMGKPEAENTPGSRTSAAAWTDIEGDLWLFGGLGVDAAGKAGFENDLWKFDTATREWTWVAGSSVVGTAGGMHGIAGEPGVPAAANIPGGRARAAVWNDAGEKTWLFGGSGLDTAGGPHALNDLWAHAANTGTAPVISSVSSVDTQASQTITITGTNLGALPAYTGDSPDILFSDVTANWGAGFDGVLGGIQYEDGIQLIVTSWTNTQIVLGGLQGIGGQYTLSCGDTYSIQVWNPQTSLESNTYTGTVSGAGCGVATPVITPGTGNYTSSQNVSITDSTSGAVIYYTTNGSTPTSSSTKYTSSIAVSGTETIEAVAILNSVSSSVATAVYTFAPTITEVSGITQSQNQGITITGNNLGALPAYSGDSSQIKLTDVTGNWAAGYTGDGVGLVVSSWTNNMIQLFGFTSPGWGTGNGQHELVCGDQLTLQVWSSTGVASNIYSGLTVGGGSSSCTVATPVLSEGTGTYDGSQSITITDATPGATIYYTTDGKTTPTASSTKYTGAIKVTATGSIWAIAIAPNYTNSAVVKATYTIQVQPVISSVSPISTAQTQTITITGTGFGTQKAYSGDSPYILIYDPDGNWGAGYIAKGATAGTGDTVGLNVTSWTDTQIVISGFTGTWGSGSGKNELACGDELQIGISNAQTNVAAVTYYTGPVGAGTQSCTVAAPTFSPNGGTFSAEQSVTITDTTSKSKIYFTIDGTTPTSQSTPFTDPVVLAANTTVKAIATRTGYSDSPVASAVFNVKFATTITSVSKVTNAQSQTFTITGKGFGGYSTYNGDSSLIKIEDVTQNFSMGNGNDPVGLLVHSWSDTSIVIQGFNGAWGNGPGENQINCGDALTFEVWNPQNKQASNVYSGVMVVSSTGGACPAVAPVILPANDTIDLATNPPQVTITDASPDSTIYYTTDKTTPTANSTKYTGPFTLKQTAVVQAIATAKNLSNSAVTSNTIVVEPVIQTVSAIAAKETQTITITGAGFATETTAPYPITMSDTTGGWNAGIGYTGSEPNTVKINITSWSDTKIVISGFGGTYGSGGASLKNGDKLYFQVAGPGPSPGPTYSQECSGVVVGAPATTCPVPTASHKIGKLN